MHSLRPRNPALTHPDDPPQPPERQRRGNRIRRTPGREVNGDLRDAGHGRGDRDPAALSPGKGELVLHSGTTMRPAQSEGPRRPGPAPGRRRARHPPTRSQVTAARDRHRRGAAAHEAVSPTPSIGPVSAATGQNHGNPMHRSTPGRPRRPGRPRGGRGPAGASFPTDTLRRAAWFIPVRACGPKSPGSHRAVWGLISRPQVSPSGFPPVSHRLPSGSSPSAAFLWFPIGRRPLVPSLRPSLSGSVPLSVSLRVPFPLSNPDASTPAGRFRGRWSRAARTEVPSSGPTPARARPARPARRRRAPGPGPASSGSR